MNFPGEVFRFFFPGTYTVLILVPWGAFEAQETLTIEKVEVWIWENLEISHKALK